MKSNLGAATQLFNSHALFGNYPHISIIASSSPHCHYQFSPFFNCHSPLPFRHLIAGVACGSLPGGHGCLRYDLRGLQRLLRLPRGAAGHGKRRGTARAAQGEEAHLYVGHVVAQRMQRMQRGMVVAVDGGWWMVDE